MGSLPVYGGNFLSRPLLGRQKSSTAPPRPLSRIRIWKLEIVELGLQGDGFTPSCAGREKGSHEESLVWKVSGCDEVLPKSSFSLSWVIGSPWRDNGTSDSFRSDLPS